MITTGCRALGMRLEDAMRTQRSIRAWTDEPVADEDLLHVLELALQAPSGGNRQPQRFVLVRDRRVKAELARRQREAWAVLGRLYARRVRSERGRRMLRAVQGHVDRFEHAPVLVVVCSAGWVPPWPPVVASTLYGSVYPSVQNLLLAARAAGLGAGLVTMPLWSATLVRRALGLPWRVQPVCVVSLGWPAEPYGPTRRRAVGEVVHVDRWGHQPFA